MNISNLKELLNAELIHAGSVSAVSGFALGASELKEGFACFASDEDEAREALNKGAFCIISEKNLRAREKDIFYFQVSDLKRAILRLLRFISEQKGLVFLALDKVRLDFAPAFDIKVLKNELHSDFKSILKAKNHSVFAFDDKEYLLCLSPDIKELESFCYELLPCASLFSTSLICEEHFYKNLPLLNIYAEIFSQFAHFAGLYHLKLNEKKLDFVRVFYVNARNEITTQSTQRAFIVVQNEAQFHFIEDKLRALKGFKVADKNTLFADFSYNELTDLRGFFDFRYCLVCADFKEFENTLQAKEPEIGLFNEIN